MVKSERFRDLPLWQKIATILVFVIAQGMMLFLVYAPFVATTKK